MDKVFKNGIAQILVMILIVLGIAAGAYLVQQQTNLKSRATLVGVPLSLQPSLVEVISSEEFTIDIFAIGGSYSITAAQIHINFDPNVLEVREIRPAIALPVVLEEGQVSGSEATIILGTDPESPFNGSGTIATLRVAPRAGLTTTTVTFNTSETIVTALNNEGNVTGSLNSATIALPVPSTGSFTNLSAQLCTNGARFGFDYGGSSGGDFIVDMGADPDSFSSGYGIYYSFASGSSSPITVGNLARMSQYAVGRNMSWRVKFADGSAESSVQTAAVSSCTLDNVPVWPYPSSGSFSNLSAQLTQSSSNFNLSYTGSVSHYEVDLSSSSDFSSDIYFKFGDGTQNTITVTDPIKMGNYGCGATLYWRVRAISEAQTAATSAVQSATVNCP